MTKRNLDDLRRDRKAAAGNMEKAAADIDALATSGVADDADDMVAAVASFDAAEAEFAGLDASVKRAEAVEQAQAAAAVGDETAPTTPAPARAKVEADKGMEVGFMLHALGNNQGNVQSASATLEGAGLGQVATAMNTATSSAGGVLVPDALYGDLIGLLKPRAVVRRSGARSVPMPAGKLRKSKITGGPTAKYTGEGGSIGSTTVTLGEDSQSFKKLTAMVPVSNDLLAMSIFDAGALVRNELVDALALREDLAFLRNDGTNGTPKGLRYWAPAGHWVADVANTVAAVRVFLRGCVSKVEDSDVAMVAPGWVMRSSVKHWLASLRDENGHLVYPSIDMDGTLLGWPIQTTSQVPNNLGVGGNESEITFADFNETMIGESKKLTLAVSTEAAYVNSSDELVSAFDLDQTLFRAITEHDFAPMHDVAISGGTVVAWGL